MNSGDPRGKSSLYSQKTSLRFKNRKFEFVPTQFIIDEHYVGEPPRVQVGFTNLNDNIDENFLRKEISKVGKIRTLEIVRHPQTRRHLGLAKVQFEDPIIAFKCIGSYNDHQLMGKKLRVFLDVRFTQIEATKLILLNPEPKIRNTPTQPKPPNPIPTVHPLNQLPFPPVQIPPSQPLDMARSNNRPSQAPLSLDDRLAKLGLKQTGVYPPMPQQAYPIQERNTTLQQYNQNHIISRQEKKVDVPTMSSQTNFEEDEKAWNPDPPKPPVEEINLTDEQIMDEVLPHCYDKFIKELQRNLLTTLQRRLIQTYGYPCINQAQERHKVERDRKALEKLREEQENKLREQEKQAMMQANNRAREKKYIGREISRSVFRKSTNPVRIRKDNDNSDLMHGRHPASGMFRRINRSAALDESHDQDGRQKSIGTPSDESDHSDRSSVRSSDSSESSSDSESSLSAFSSCQSSRSPSPSIEIERTPKRLKIDRYETDEPIKPTEDSEKVAAEALTQLQFTSQNHSSEKVLTPKEELVAKKRKKKTEQEKIAIKKAKTEDAESRHEPKPVTFPERSKDLIEKLYSSLDIDLEDKQYLGFCNSEHEKKQDSAERTKIPFGSLQADVHIMIRDNDIGSELAKSYHPKWWNGCSRTSIIEISDKGKIEEAVDYDLQKAAIKSHVIQAANSTRRDQRNDQRKLAALNPDIDPLFLKQFTSNTLQMRAKNLRFSRSKIHKWGLFACEKIANGDAVIEYVGEKIRPSVADHREKIVYTNLPTHDGSSYFFRVDSDVIDATLKGNKARFINHSCNPNCIAKVIKHENGTNSIVIYAKQAIQEDEEITYDYKFPREENGEKIFCRCKAPNCQKYLN